MKPVKQMAVLSIATSIATLGLKFAAYALTDSVGLLSDALEALVNLAAGLVAFTALSIAEQPADARHSYGHDKAEYFASGVEGTLIVAAAIAIVYAAWSRFLHPVELQHLGSGIAVGIAAAAMNYATARVMLKVATKYDSIAVEADAKHLFTDVWTSAGVLAGLVIILAAPEAAILDPLIGIGVGLHIVYTGVGLLRRSIEGLMDTALTPAEIETAQRLISEQLPEGASFHALRSRKSGPRRFIEFHLLVPGKTSVHQSHALCDRIEQSLCAHLANASITIHVEPCESHRHHDLEGSSSSKPADSVR